MARRSSVLIVDKVSLEPARDLQDLERLLVSRERAGDVDGMAALYEPHAVLDCGSGRLAHGGKQSENFSPDWWPRVESLISEINARQLSVETWHLRQLGVLMEA